MNDVADGISSTSARSLLQLSYSISDRIANGFFDRQTTLTQTAWAPTSVQTAAAPSDAMARASDAGVSSGPGPQWDAWLDGRYNYVDDDRWGRDSRADVGEVGLGVDKRFGESLFGGIAAGWEGGEIDTFGGFANTDFNGLFVGPYIGYGVNENVLVDLWVGYARDWVDKRVGPLGADFNVDRVFMSANVTGQWDLGALNLRPRATVYYSHDWREDFSLGPVPVDDVNGGFGTLDLMIEANRVFKASETVALVPFARIGGRWAFERYNDGKVLGADLAFHKPSSLIGDARAGVRILAAGRAVIELSGAYNSIGHDDLNAIDARASVSLFF